MWAWVQRRFGVFQLKIAGLGQQPGSGEGGGRDKVPLGHPGGGWVVFWGGGDQGASLERVEGGNGYTRGNHRVGGGVMVR